MKDREPRVQSVARAINILMAVAQSNAGLNGPGIVSATGLPKQATYHLVHTLVTTGMLTRNEQGLYILGLRIGIFAEAFRRQLAPLQHLTAVLRRVSDETGETAYVSGWLNGEIVTLATSRGTNSVQAREIPHGTYGDAHARGAGKLLLAFAPIETSLQYLRSHSLTKRTRKTITSLPRLQKEFARIKEQGYAIDREEYLAGVTGICVPIDQGSLPYALSVSFPAERFETNFAGHLKTMLKIASSLVGARRAYQPGTRNTPLRGSKAS